LPLLTPAINYSYFESSGLRRKCRLCLFANCRRSFPIKV